MKNNDLIIFHDIGPVTVATTHLANLLGGPAWHAVTHALNGMVANKAKPHLLLNLQNAQHISIEMFYEMIDLNKRIGASGGSMKLCGLRKAIREMLTATGLDEQLCIEGDVSHALPRYVHFIRQQERKQLQMEEAANTAGIR